MQVYARGHANMAGDVHKRLVLGPLSDSRVPDMVDALGYMPLANIIAWLVACI